MKIGDEVYIHGYIDEIRKDIVIIRNGGGYFGTVGEEIRNQPITDPEEICRLAHYTHIRDIIGEWNTDYYARKSKAEYFDEIIATFPIGCEDCKHKCKAERKGADE